MNRIGAFLLAAFMSHAVLGQTASETQPIPKDYNAVKDRSVIILYRNDFFFFGSKPIAVYINGSAIGTLRGNTFVRLVIPPGRYTLGANAEGGSAKLSLDAAVGQVHFVWLDAQIAFPVGPRAHLSLVDESQGKADLSKCDACTEAEGAIKDADELGLTSRKRDDLRERLQSLKRLFDDALITKEEYDAKRKAILDGI